MILNIWPTLSNLQASKAAIVKADPSATNWLEWDANAVNVSAAALRVAQSLLSRHSRILCSTDGILWGLIAPACDKLDGEHFKDQLQD